MNRAFFKNSVIAFVIGIVSVVVITGCKSLSVYDKSIPADQTCMLRVENGLAIKSINGKLAVYANNLVILPAGTYDFVVNYRADNKYGKNIPARFNFEAGRQYTMIPEITRLSLRTQRVSVVIIDDDKVENHLVAQNSAETCSLMIERGLKIVKVNGQRMIYEGNVTLPAGKYELEVNEIILDGFKLNYNFEAGRKYTMSAQAEVDYAAGRRFVDIFITDDAVVEGVIKMVEEVFINTPPNEPTRLSGTWVRTIKSGSQIIKDYLTFKGNTWHYESDYYRFKNYGGLFIIEGDTLKLYKEGKVTKENYKDAITELKFSIRLGYGEIGTELYLKRIKGLYIEGSFVVQTQ